MSRVLSIDYGKKRTGIAVTDPERIIANGLTTVNTNELMDFLKAYIAKETVGRFVVGMPMQTNGKPSENAPRVTAFISRLQKIFPNIPITLSDERFTSVLAHQTILTSGVGRKRREQDKGLVDEISACIILQSWLESRQDD